MSRCLWCQMFPTHMRVPYIPVCLGGKPLSSGPSYCLVLLVNTPVKVESWSCYLVEDHIETKDNLPVFGHMMHSRVVWFERHSRYFLTELPSPSFLCIESSPKKAINIRALCIPAVLVYIAPCCLRVSKASEITQRRPSLCHPLIPPVTSDFHHAHWLRGVFFRLPEANLAHPSCGGLS